MAVDATMTPDNEAERLKALRRYDLLDTPPDGAFDRITALAARLYNVPIAIVSLVDHDRIWFKSHHGLELEQIGRDPGLCASAILHQGPWIINDAPRDARSLSNPLVAGEFGLKFYAGVPLETSDGHRLGTLCILDFEPRSMTAQDASILQDLANVVMSEMELRLASRQALFDARHREELKDAFVGMLSHELRTPVTTIYAAAQLLARSPALNDDPRAADLVPDIRAESERLLGLIDNLLVLTRLERGRLEAEPEPVLIQRVLRRAIDHEARRWPGREINLDIAPGLTPVEGDPLFVEQVVVNLLSNALKYSAADGAVDVSVRELEAEVEVRVRDRGIGLHPDSHEAIFELLARTQEATRYAPGAGIGLYVCRRLLAAMGGRIWVEPADGRGTVFCFRLPTITA